MTKDVDGDSAYLQKQLAKQERQIKKLEKENSVLALSFGKCFCMFRIDLRTGNFQYLGEEKELERFVHKADSLEKMLHLIVGSFVVPDDQEAVLEFLDPKTIGARMSDTDELTFEYKDIFIGKCRFEIHATSRDEEGWLESVLVNSIALDIQEQREELFARVEQEVYQRIEQQDISKECYDIFTGLLNEEGFKRVVPTIDSSEKIVLLIIDADDMKKFNEEHGVFIATDSLNNVGSMLRDSFRHTDNCARLSSDGFVVILRHQRGMDKKLITTKVNEINGVLGMSRYPISISVGIAYSENGFAEGLLEHAEAALAYVKEHGKHGYCFYDELDEASAGEAEQKKRSWMDENGRRFIRNHYDVNEAKGATHKENTRSWYSEEMFYQLEDYGELVNKKQYYIDLVLRGNKAVGVVTAFLDDDLSLYCISGFGMKGLGYEDFDEFSEKIDGSFLKLVHPEDRNLLIEKLQEPVISRFKLRLMNVHGVPMWHDFTTMVITGSDGRLMWVGSMRSIDDLMISSICERDYLVVGLINTGTGQIALNKNNFRNAGRKLNTTSVMIYNDILGNEAARFVRPEDKEALLTNLCLSNVQEKLEHQGIFEYIAYHKNADGRYVPIRHKYRYFDKARNLLLVTEENVAGWAEQDPLSGLLNESGFYRNAEEFLRGVDNTQDYAILFFNIRGFKAVNAVLGEHEGNIILKNLGHELKTSELSPIFTARFRADHFFLLVERKHVDTEVIAHICDMDVMAENSFLHLHMRCGICFMDEMEKESRLTCDKAVLAARRVQGEAPVAYCFYDDSMKEDYLQRADIVSRLNHALSHNEFHVYYQPIYNAQTKKIASAEALVRWYHPEKGVIAPCVFIPTLEKNGRIAALDLFVYKNTVAFMCNRRRLGKSLVPVSMNLSRTDFMNTQMVEELLESVQESPLPNKYMKFEVTESAIMDVGEQGAHVLDELHTLGCSILLDDFGVGASSLSSLTDGKFDIIKLDMSFTRSIGKNHRTEEIIKASIDLAHKMGNKVVGEGVETEEQYAFLRDAGCDYIQGYYFSKPLSQEEFAGWLDSGK